MKRVWGLPACTHSVVVVPLCGLLHLRIEPVFFVLNGDVAGWYQNHHSVASAWVVFMTVDMKITLTPYTRRHFLTYPKSRLLSYNKNFAQTLYLHESCKKSKCEVCKTAMLPFDMSVASSSVVFMIHAASWHETYIHAQYRTGSKPTAQISLPKTSGLRIHPTWTPWINMSGAMLEAYHKRHPKPKTIAELKEVMQVIWDSLPQRPIDKAVKEFSKRLKACVAADGGHFEHLQ